MSNVNDAILVWRRELEQSGGVPADDVNELESHLQQEMETLQQSGLRPDEAFVIAARRLGHPADLAAEYSKNDALMSWRRPARLVLWGLLILEALSLTWSAILLGLSLCGLLDLLNTPLSRFAMWTTPIIHWAGLALFWRLAETPHGRVSRLLSRAEGALQTRLGILVMLFGATAYVAVNVAIRLTAAWMQDRLNQVGTPEYNFANFGMFLELFLPYLAWVFPIVLILVSLVRVEKPSRAKKLAVQ